MALSDSEYRAGRHGVPVNGYRAAMRTVYEFNGCYWHDHSCDAVSSIDIDDRTAADASSQRSWRCCAIGTSANEIATGREGWCRAPTKLVFLHAYFDGVFGIAHNRPTSEAEILRDVLKGCLFGYVECDLHVPYHLHEYFGKMLPIFRNVDVGHEHLSDHMRAHVKETGALK